MTAISTVYTIGLVAEILSKDKEWLWDLSIDIVPRGQQFARLRHRQDGVPAFTQFGIEYLQEVIREQRTAGKAPTRQTKSTE